MAKTAIFCISLFFIPLIEAGAQCFPANLTLENQAEVDEYLFNHPDCTELANVYIYEDSPGAIQNLEGLKNLEIIHGSLVIRDNSELPKLSGLRNLRKIVGSLNIYRNESLKDLEGLEQLDSIGESLLLRELPSLNSLNSLANLDHIQLGILLTYLPALSDLEGLHNIESLETDVTLRYVNIVNFEGLRGLKKTSEFHCTYLPDLIDVSGLSNLTEIDNLLMHRCDGLVEFQGLESLQIVNENIEFSQMAALTSINFGENFKTFGSDLDIYLNPNLEFIDGFNGLEKFGGKIRLSDNDNLSKVEGFNNLKVIGEILIKDRNILNFNIFENLETVESDFSMAWNHMMTATTFPKLKEVFGSFSNYVFDIQDYDGFQELEYVGDDFIIANTTLNLMPAFENLKVVGGDFVLDNLIELESIDAFDQLEVVNGKFLMEDFGKCTSIEGFSKLKSVGHEFIIRRNYALKLLPDFDNLAYVGGALSFGSSSSPLGELENFPKFPVLEEILGSLTILNLDKIRKLDGFDELITIGGNLRIEDIDNLNSFQGFVKLESIGGFMELSACRGSASVDAFNVLNTIGADLIINRFNVEELRMFEELISIDGNLEITNNQKIVDFGILEKLKSINGNFKFIFNLFAEHIDNFKELERINGSLIIDSNGSLYNIEGISNLIAETINSQDTTIADIQIKNNFLLSDCAIKPICDYLDLGLFNTDIVDNAEGCNSIDEIDCTPETVGTTSFTEFPFAVYPNPAHSVLHIPGRDEHPVNLQLKDIGGRTVITTMKSKIDLIGVPAGLYFLTAVVDGVFISEKVVVEK